MDQSGPLKYIENDVRLLGVNNTMSKSRPGPEEVSPSRGGSMFKRRPKPSYYPDDDNPELERWWDGKQWTDKTRPSLEGMRSALVRDLAHKRAARAEDERNRLGPDPEPHLPPEPPTMPSDEEAWLIRWLHAGRSRKSMVSKLKEEAWLYEPRNAQDALRMGMILKTGYVDLERAQDANLKWNVETSESYQARVRQTDRWREAKKAHDEWEDRRKQASEIDKMLPGVVSKIVDALWDARDPQKHTSLGTSGFFMFFSPHDAAPDLGYVSGLEASLAPADEHGVRWVGENGRGEVRVKVPLVRMVRVGYRNEFVVGRTDTVETIYAMVVDRFAERVKQETDMREAPIRTAEAAPAAELEQQTERAAKKVACDALAATLSAAAAGREVRKVILSPAGPRRGVADIRFTDGTSHVVDVVDPLILPVLQSSHNDAIEELRRLVEERLIQIVDNDSYFEFWSSQED